MTHTDEPRFLTTTETSRRRADQASSAPGAAIDMCAHPGCGDQAHYGPFCARHRPEPEPTIGIAHNLTENDYHRIRAEIDAKAAPLFLIAMNWLATRQLNRMGINLEIATEDPA